MTSGYTEFAKPEVTETIISSINSLWFPVLCWGSARMLSLLVSRMFPFLLNPTYPACLCLFITSDCCSFFSPAIVTSAALNVFRFVSFVNSHAWPCACLFKPHIRSWVFFALLQVNVRPDNTWTGNQHQSRVGRLRARRPHAAAVCSPMAVCSQVGLGF